MKTTILKILLIAIITGVYAQERKTIGSIERLMPEMRDFIPDDREIEILAEGFGWSEGPVWVDNLNALLFSDVPGNKVYKWSEEEGLSVFLNPSGYTGIAPREKKGSKNAMNRDESGSNGLVLDKSGQLIICMHGDRRVARLTHWGKNDFTTIVGKYQGKYFNSPNDLVYAKNGDLYFTDQGQTGIIDPTGRVFRLTASGELHKLVTNAPSPNGITVNNSENQVYVAITRSQQIWRLPLMADNSVSKSGVAIQLSGGHAGPDGLEMDSEDGMIVNHLGVGVWRFDSNCLPTHLIYTDNHSLMTNTAFGGPDRKTLYITDSMNGRIMRASLPVAGKLLYGLS